MFQFGGFPTYTYVFSIRSLILHQGGFPIRKSTDITLICSSPWLIAACHVLHRLLMPRHSPYALLSLNFSGGFDFTQILGSLMLELLCITFLQLLVLSLSKIVFCLPNFRKDQFLNCNCLSCFSCTCSCTFEFFIRFSMITAISRTFNLTCLSGFT